MLKSAFIWHHPGSDSRQWSWGLLLGPKGLGRRSSIGFKWDVLRVKLRHGKAFGTTSFSSSWILVPVPLGFGVRHAPHSPCPLQAHPWFPHPRQAHLITSFTRLLLYGLQLRASSPLRLLASIGDMIHREKLTSNTFTTSPCRDGDSKLVTPRK